MKAFSLVISGQIKSRIDSEGGVQALEQAFKCIKSINLNNELVISTFEGEINKKYEKFIDKIIINKDPGPDHFKVYPWPIGNEQNRYFTNYSRLFTTTISGISASKNDLIIKTRIELLPIKKIEFEKWLDKILKSLYKVKTPRIAFFAEHYNGIGFSIDGTLGTLPNTLQIGQKQILLDTWNTSQKFWYTNKKILTRKAVKFPITDEQIVGLNFLYLYCGFNINSEISKLKRYYFSSDLVTAILRAEKNMFIWTKYSQSGIASNKFSGSLKVVTPIDIKINSSLTLFSKIFILKLKKYKHITRRIFQGLRYRILHYNNR
jgi:hypothetical protein